ncbi:MAG: hypothetical protein R3F62_05085 [Planctomycetota bacterium]
MSETPDPNELSRRIVTKIERSATELPTQRGKIRGIRSDDLKRLLEDSLRPERDRFRAEEERYKQRLRALERELDEVRAQGAETRRRELPRLAQLVESERSRVESLQGELQGMEQKLRTRETELEESKRMRRDTERQSAALVRELHDLRQSSSTQLNEASSQAEELLLTLDSRIAEIERKLSARGDLEATQQIDLRARNAALAEQAARVRALEDEVWTALEGATQSGQVRRRVREDRRNASEDPDQARVLLLREIVRRQHEQEDLLEEIQLTLQNYEARLMSLEHRQREGGGAEDPGPSEALQLRLEALEERHTDESEWIEHLERRLQELEVARPTDDRSRDVAQRTDQALAGLETLLARARGVDLPPLPTGAEAGPPPPRSFTAPPSGVPPASGAYALPKDLGALAAPPQPLEDADEDEDEDDDGEAPSREALENTSHLTRTLVASMRGQSGIKDLLREALYADSPELAAENGVELPDGGYSAEIEPPFAEVRERAIRACEEGISLLESEGKAAEASGIKELLAWLHSTPDADDD